MYKNQDQLQFLTLSESEKILLNVNCAENEKNISASVIATREEIKKAFDRTEKIQVTIKQQ